MNNANHTTIDNMLDVISPNLKKILIYKNDLGQYVLFEEYFITKISDYYEVKRYRDDFKINFGSLRNCTAWAILDYHNKIIEAKRILELDIKIESLKAEILIHNHLKKQGTLEFIEIQRDKLLECQSKQKQFKWELDKYIIMAKTCQERGYKNEFTRTS